jgi:hypothetical protein
LQGKSKQRRGVVSSVAEGDSQIDDFSRKDSGWVAEREIDDGTDLLMKFGRPWSDIVGVADPEFALEE